MSTQTTAAGCSFNINAIKNKLVVEPCEKSMQYMLKGMKKFYQRQDIKMFSLTDFMTIFLSTIK